VEHLEEALETLIQLTGPLFNDNADDIQEAPTSMMDHGEAPPHSVDASFVIVKILRKT